MRTRWWRLLGVLGEVLLTVGVLVLLYAGYLLLWTNVRAEAAAEAEVAALRSSWSQAAPGQPAAASAPPARTRTRVTRPEPPPAGAAFALLSIPRLGEDWVRPVLEGSGDGPGGISDDDLERGTVHYPGTALPGERGNFAVAGHRATHGEPFRDLDRLVPGDVVEVRTATERLSYRVTGQRIVAPQDGEVLLPVPGRPGARADRARLTLTTCHPRWASTWRLVVFAELEA